MRRPSFQFYAADWQGNAKLRRCTHGEKGVWIDTLCLMHDSEEYGVLRWPLKEVALGVGCKVCDLSALRRKEVLKGADLGETCPAFVYTPRHGGKDGEPVTLLPEQPGPIWYSSRMVRDEYVRAHAGAATRFGSPSRTPSHREGEQSSQPSQRAGPGASSSASSSTSTTPLNPLPPSPEGGVPDGTRAPDCPHEKIVALYHEILPTNPQVIEWTDTRKGYLRQRWREKAKPNGVSQGYRTLEEGLAYWRRFFEWCAQSKFLTGQSTGRPGQPPFVADLAWLLRPENFAKVIEGKYSDR